jgi:hypothetical protein
MTIFVFVPLNEEFAKFIYVLCASHHVCENGADTRLKAGILAEGSKIYAEFYLPLDIN